MDVISTDSGSDFDFIRYWKLVRPRLWIVVILAIVVAVLAGVVAKNMPSIYAASTTILMAPEQAKTVSMGTMFHDQSRERSYFDTQKGIIKSRKIMGEVVNELGLGSSHEAEPPDPSMLLELKSMLNMNVVEPTEEERHQMILAQLQDHISLTSQRLSKLMKLSYESTSPEMATKVVNTVAEIYIRDNLEYRLKIAHQATAWMSERATALKKQLTQAEDHLQAFIEREGLVNVGVGVASLTSQELTALTDRRIEARAKVSELRQRYGAKHPKLIAARSELALANAALVRGKEKIRKLGRQDVKLKALQREVESTRKLYETFVNRLKETDQASMQITEVARIVDPAVVPLYPIKPARKKIVVAAFGLTLAAGIFLIILLDMLDSTIHTINQVETKLGMPMLGLLPSLKFKSKKQSLAECLHEMTSGNNHQFIEAIRTIRTGIMLSAIDNPHKVILITSTMPGEGKSTVAANLAIAMGKLERVLLLDADLRRPTVGKHFGMNTKEKGLSELVAGAAKFKDCLERNDTYQIDVMHAGIVPPNPLELLASDRFKAVLKSLENHYDRIIIDSTPVQAVSDALVLSKYAKGVVYVVKADATPDRVIKNCFKRLREVDAPIIGVVLNQVDIKKSVRYGYEDYEGYYDHYGYSTTDEKA